MTKRDNVYCGWSLTCINKEGCNKTLSLEEKQKLLRAGVTITYLTEKLGCFKDGNKTIKAG